MNLLIRNSKLTVLQATNILYVRKEYLNQLLETGQLTYQDTELGRFVEYDEVISYKKKMDAAHREGLRQLAEMSQEWGLYDK